VGPQGVTGADRHRGLLDQDQRLLAMASDCIADRQHILEVCRTIRAGGGANGDEGDPAMFDGKLFIGGELQAAAIQAFAHQAGKARFEDADMALAQQLDLLLVDIHAHHIMADLGQYRGLHQADVPATKHCNFHGALLNAGERAGRVLIVMTPSMTSATPSDLLKLKDSSNSGRLAANR